MAETTVTVVAAKRKVLDPYIKNRSNDIDISFSSYLEPNNNQQQQQKELEDTELSIFEAKSYFSESNRFNGPRFSSVSSSAKISSFTVAASSEASWNSQTGLLRNNNQNQSNRNGSSKKGGGSRWFFRRRTCPCSNSKSVQVQETKPRIAESKTGSDRTVSNRIVHHQMLSSSDPIRLTIPSNTVTRSIDYAVNRESKAPVSNFSFPSLQSSEKPENPVLNPIKPVLHPIKTVLNPIKPVLNPTSPKCITTEEEATSDASSDLFEIESFSTQPAIRPWAPPVRNSIDENRPEVSIFNVPTLDENHEADTEYGYEPSEASVTWSVTTAEPVSAVASNFSRLGLSSIAFSDCDKRRNGLLSCRCEKAVMVSGGERLMQPFKSVSVQDEIKEKVLCNNGSSKLSLTSRPMPEIKSSFLV